MARPPLLLSSVLAVSSPLRASVQAGIGALLRRDRKLIALAEHPKIGDSLNFDEATSVEFPQAHRWDYLCSVPGASHIVGIEPHSAKDSEISVVIAKKRHAIEYLHGHLPPKHRVAKWFWVSHGRVSFSRMEPARRRLDQNGIAFEGRMLRSL